MPAVEGLYKFIHKLAPFQIYSQTGTLPDLFTIRPHSNFIHKRPTYKFIHKPAFFQIYSQTCPFPNLFTTRPLSKFIHKPAPFLINSQSDPLEIS